MGEAISVGAQWLLLIGSFFVRDRYTKGFMIGVVAGFGLPALLRSLNLM